MNFNVNSKEYRRNRDFGSISQNNTTTGVSNHDSGDGKPLKTGSESETFKNRELKKSDAPTIQILLPINTDERNRVLLSKRYIHQLPLFTPRSARWLTLSRFNETKPVSLPAKRKTPARQTIRRNSCSSNVIALKYLMI
jgi:hypothetical protein